MSWNPQNDGKDHVNVYSQGRTLLGRLLSNFAHTPFILDGETFESVEGYWYWIQTGDERLRHLHGFEAKDLGRRLAAQMPVSSQRGISLEQLRRAYAAKLSRHPLLHQELKECKLPLAHYYVYGDKVVQPMEWQWTVGLWEEFK